MANKNRSTVTSGGARIISVSRIYGRTDIVITFDGVTKYRYNETNCSESQLQEMVRWGSKPGFTRWLHSEGIVNRAIKMKHPTKAKAKVEKKGG